MSYQVSSVITVSHHVHQIIFNLIMKLGKWDLIEAGGLFSPRFGHSSFIDPSQGVLYNIFGQCRPEEIGVTSICSDVWSLNILNRTVVDWNLTHMDVPGLNPIFSRAYHTNVFDTIKNTAFIIGGFTADDDDIVSDVVLLSLKGK